MMTKRDKEHRTREKVSQQIHEYEKKLADRLVYWDGTASLNSIEIWKEIGGLKVLRLVMWE